MDTWEPDEIDFEDQYDKADPIDDEDLDASMKHIQTSKEKNCKLDSKGFKMNKKL